MFVQLGPDVDVGALDGGEDQLGHPLALLVDEVRLEQRLTRLEPLPANLHIKQRIFKPSNATKEQV